MAHRADPVRAIFWEQGTGKSKALIDRACWLYTSGCIDALVVVAPDGVHSNWTMVNDTPETWGELQKHVWETIDWKAFTFHTSKSGTKYHLEEGRNVYRHTGLAVLAITYDAIMTEKGQKVFEGFLKGRRCLVVLDESTRIKTPNAKRTKRLIAAGKRAFFRDILSGTPVAESPFDAYSQIRFLEPDFWVRHGIPTFTAFKAEFAVLETFQQDADGRWVKLGGDELDDPAEPEPQGDLALEGSFDYGEDAGSGFEFASEPDAPVKRAAIPYNREAKHFTKIKEFKNLDRLNDLINSIGTRVTKDDVLDLPEKLYSMRLFDMTREQRRIYTELKEEALAWLDSGQTEFVSGILPIVRLLRLQQITNGYVSPDGSDDVTMIEGKNPRLDLLRELTDDVGTSTPHIIWARFQVDIDLISDQLRRDGFSVSVVDGRVVGKDRERAKLAFKDGTVTRYVANPAAAAEGDTFVHCRRVSYYSNSFRLSHRLQSEDRTHRIGQTECVLYDDLACAGTVDFKLIQALRAKQVVSAQVLGDELRKWLI